MGNEPTQFIETLERHLGLLRELAGEMHQARAALASMNLEGIYEHNARQSDLCERLRVEQAHPHRAQGVASVDVKPSAGGEELRGWLASLDAPTSRRIRNMLRELAATANEIREMNCVQTRLIQGTRRTLHVMGNAFASFAPTYTLPQPLAHSAEPQVQP
ncbi:MAG: hypothetical protein ACRD4M_09610 [Candidatus Acidiferrales bacterium]